MLKLNKFKGFDYEQLNSYSEIEDYLLDTECDVHELGLSSGGDMVYGLSVGDLSRPMIFIDGAIHGAHEWRTTHWVKEFIERIKNPLDNPNRQIINEMKANLCFMVVPCLNTYGYLNNSYLNANGVNLNRNFPVGFENQPDDTVPWDSQYRGEYPLSEPESQIIKSIIDTYRVIGYVNCHTWGGYENGVFETSSAEIRYRTMLYDIKRSVELSTDFDVEYRQRSYPARAWVTEWVGRESNKSGGTVVSTIFETGNLETEYRQAELGMTGLFTFSYYIYNWFKGRKLILN